MYHDTHKLPPYHVFEHMGMSYAYDTSACRFLQIDAATKDFLSLCLEMPLAEAKKAFNKIKKHKAPLRVGVLKETALLAKSGLFDVPDYSMSEAAFDAQLLQRYTAPWNKLELSLSENCNLACKYCYCATCRDMPSKGIMPVSVVKQAITWLFAVSGKSEDVSITFFGGEPLMNKAGLRSAIEYSQRLGQLHDKKVFYSMTTNGTLLDDEVIGFIKRYNFGLMVSLDGQKALHDAQCPTQDGRGSFDLATKGIKRLMQRRRSVTVRCTMIHPLPDMMQLINFFEEFGFTRIVLGKTTNPVNPSPVDCNESDFESYFEQEQTVLIPWMLEKLKKGETPKYYPYSGIAQSIENNEFTAKVSPFRCGACRGTTTVGADGTLYPCHRFVGMKQWQIGHVSEGPDLEKCKTFWRSYRESVRKCYGCWLWTLCKGPCPWETAQADGTFSGPRTATCAHAERYVKNGIHFYTLMKQNGISINKPPQAENKPLQAEKQDSEKTLAPLTA